MGQPVSIEGDGLFPKHKGLQKTQSCLANATWQESPRFAEHGNQTDPGSLNNLYSQLRNWGRGASPSHQEEKTLGAS